MAIVSQIDSVLNDMKGLNKTDADYRTKLDNYYSECQELVSGIYGTTLRTQKTSEINTLYNRSK